MKEFGEDPEIDPNEEYEKDSRETVTNFSVIEREEMTAEDLAGTLSSNAAFKGHNPKSFILKAIFPNEDPKTIDIDLPNENMVIIYSHKFKFRTYFDQKVLPGSIKSSFLKQKSELEIIIKQK